LYAKAQAEAFKQGVDTSKFGLEQQLKGAGVMGTLAGQQQNLGFADVQNQLGIGQLAKDENQKALDLAYSNFQQEQMHPKQQLQFLGSILKGDPNAHPGLAQQSTMVQQPSFFEQAIGYGAQGLGIAANLGWKPFK